MFVGLAAAAAAVLIAGCSASVSVGDQNVTKPADAQPGSCITIGGDNPSSATVRKADCGSADLTFYVANTVPKSGSCDTNNYSYVTFPGSDDKLCLALNMRQGECYQINTSNITQYKRIDCAAKPAEGATALKAVSRTDGVASCGEGQMVVNYTQPKTVGYCLEQTS